MGRQPPSDWPTRLSKAGNVLTSAYASSGPKTARPQRCPVMMLSFMGTPRSMSLTSSNRMQTRASITSKQRATFQKKAADITPSFLCTLRVVHLLGKRPRSWCKSLRTTDNCHRLLIPSASDGKEKWLHGEVRGSWAQTGNFPRVSDTNHGCIIRSMIKIRELVPVLALHYQGFCLWTSVSSCGCSLSPSWSTACFFLSLWH